MWCYDSFQAAHAHSGLLEKYVEERNDQTHWALSAFSKSLISEYARPFVSSRNLDSRKGVSTKYLRRHADFDSNLHGELLELRNNIVAHSDVEVEGQELQVILASFNGAQNRKSKHQSVHIPVQIFANSVSFWYFTDHSKVKQIQNHCDVCVQLTNTELLAECENLQELLVQNAAWANQLDAAFTYLTDEKNNAEGISQQIIAIADERKELKVGDASFQTRITQFENTLGDEREWNCDGYKVKRQNQDGKINFLVTFEDIT